MACGATLKRPMEFEAALLSPGSPKRRRCAPLALALPLPNAAAAAAALREPGPDPPQPSSPPLPPPPPPQPTTADRRLPTPEQIFWNIKQEYSRYQRRRQLEGVNQSDACAPESHSHCSILTAPSSPGSPWVKKDQPTFTLRQVGILCERLLKDYEDRIREEYEQILNTKLAEQYESFVKFTHDQIMRRYGARPTSYVS
ncbi:akirin-1 [Tachyglossus aculeatus]|uniref:akirin-1 n=1 Tax=Tachyglossus aculeatus TaxID=9261 RepID=UPI0018F3804C|nr:akirin-1 [Tachyglossus aculeatus]